MGYGNDNALPGQQTTISEHFKNILTSSYGCVQTRIMYIEGCITVVTLEQYVYNLLKLDYCGW